MGGRTHETAEGCTSKVSAISDKLSDTVKKSKASQVQLTNPIPNIAHWCPSSSLTIAHGFLNFVRGGLSEVTRPGIYFAI